MRNCLNYIIVSIAILLSASCANKDDQTIGSPEQVLPGLWRIDSVELSGYNEGVTYRGSTFFTDTVLLQVGKIQISSFSIDSLEALDLGQHRVECMLDISEGEMSVALTSLYEIGAEWKATIFYNGPDGFQLIDTPIEEFYTTAHIFNNFYTLEIVDNHTAKLWTSNDTENHVISLTRD